MTDPAPTPLPPTPRATTWLALETVSHAETQARHVYKLPEGRVQRLMAISRWTDMAIMALILANVTAAIIETVDDIGVPWAGWFAAFEAVSVLIFTVEYVLRTWASAEDPRYRKPFLGRVRFALTPMALVDLIAIAPWWASVMMGMPLADARMLRALRLFRVIRLFKFGRYATTLNVMRHVIVERREELIVSLMGVGILLVVSSTLMYWAENDAQPEVFSSIPATMWWAIATLTTVGYGDMAPVTAVGRTLGGVIAVLGIGLFALPAGILSAGFSDALQQRREKRRRRIESRLAQSAEPPPGDHSPGQE